MLSGANVGRPIEQGLDVTKAMAVIFAEWFVLSAQDLDLISRFCHESPPQNDVDGSQLHPLGSSTPTSRQLIIAIGRPALVLNSSDDGGRTILENAHRI